MHWCVQRSSPGRNVPETRRSLDTQAASESLLALSSPVGHLHAGKALVSDAHSPTSVTGLLSPSSADASTRFSGPFGSTALVASVQAGTLRVVEFHHCCRLICMHVLVVELESGPFPLLLSTANAMLLAIACASRFPELMAWSSVVFRQHDERHGLRIVLPFIGGRCSRSVCILRSTSQAAVFEVSVQGPSPSNRLAPIPAEVLAHLYDCLMQKRENAGIRLIEHCATVVDPISVPNALFLIPARAMPAVLYELIP